MKRSDRPNNVTKSTPRHEYYSGSGSTVLHRIVTDKLNGQWFTYQQIATLKTPSGILHACTDYFHGSMPTNVVFTIQEIV